MLLQRFLEDTAQRTPDKVALVCDGQRLTYAAFDAQANRLAHGLLAGGVRRGDCVAIYLPNSVEAAVGIWAALKAGATFVVINPGTKSDKLTYILNNCRAAALLSHSQRGALLEEVCPQVTSLRCLVSVGVLEGRVGLASLHVETYESLQASMPAARPPCRAIDVDLAALIYTSGTTGSPKGVMATHHNMVSVATSIATYLENGPEDTILNVLPLAFGYGLYQLLVTCQVGATLVLERGFAYPVAILQRIASERATGLAGVPTIYATFLQMQGWERLDLSSLRYMTNAAAALPVEHVRRLRALLPHVALYSMYGQTECQRVAYLPPAQLDARAGSVGIAIPNTEVWIVDAQGQRVGPNVVGELVVRGSHVTRGYWEDPAETAKHFRPGPWPGETVLYTGDLFHMDEEGYLYFEGRQDDIIKSRGEKVSPIGIENVLYALPGIAEAAVVGVPDVLLGEAVKAYVVLADGASLTPTEIMRHCRKHLEEYMVPAAIVFRQELPKSASGKILKTTLRQEA